MQKNVFVFNLCAGFRIYQLWQILAAGKFFCTMLIIQSNLSLHSVKQRNGQCWISILKFILSKVLCFTDLNIRGEIYIYTEV